MPYVINPLNPTSPGLFPTKNVQVTKGNQTQSRSESEVAINPLNPSNIVGASKKFYDPINYKFYLGVYYSFDAGDTWNESTLPLHNDWQGMTDPALTFDTSGNVFLVGEPLLYQNDITGLGMVVYKSSNGGVTWDQPIQLSTSPNDDKQWIIADDRLSSPFVDNIYAVWGANQNCGFSRSSNHGASWNGTGNAPSPSYLEGFSVYAPAIITDSLGWIHIFNVFPGSSSSIQYIRSKDGGVNFEAVKTIVSNLKGLEVFPETNGFPTFPGGQFRIRTILTAATGNNQTLIVAWPDTREGASRIYYRLSRDGGNTWEGPGSGSSLLPRNVNWGTTQCFMPQLAGTASGTIGCAFYTFGTEAGSNKNLINVYMVASYDDGLTFPYITKVTDSGWDPLINAPVSHGHKEGAPDLHFIGDYFGIAATDDYFMLFWTDTRTRVQEIFCDRVATRKSNLVHMPDEVAEVLFGVTNDGSGIVIVGGKIIRVPPRSPLIKVLESLNVIDSAQNIGGLGGQAIKQAGLNAIKLEINRMLKNRMA